MSLHADEVYTGFGRTGRWFAVDLWDVSWTFAAGHRIGLQLASASFPRFDVNLGTGEAPGVGTLDDAIVADQTVFHDADRPSALVIPVV